MNFNTLSLIAFLSVASAAPSVRPRSTIAVGDKFGLTAIHSGADVHLQPFQAANSGIIIGAAAQNATCDSESNTAAFTLNDDGSLSLYSTDAPYQTTYVDASGMGQGVFQYTTGAQGIPTNAQRSNFTLDENDDLFFNGAAFLACPYLDNSYTVWVEAGVTNPAGNTNCTGIVVRATKLDAPVSCTYSQ